MENHSQYRLWIGSFLQSSFADSFFFQNPNFLSLLIVGCRGLESMEANDGDAIADAHKDDDKDDAK